MKKIKLEPNENLQEKQAKILAKVEEYKAAQQHQLNHGGPGPVADYLTMEIVNEHNGEFEIIEFEIIEPEVEVIVEKKLEE